TCPWSKPRIRWPTTTSPSGRACTPNDRRRGGLPIQCPAMSAPADESKHWLEPPEWWKKSKPLRWVPIVIALAIVLPGLWVAKNKLAPAVHPEKEKFTAVAADPVVFLDTLKSYDTLAAVRGGFDAAKIQYNTTSVHPPASGKY